MKALPDEEGIETFLYHSISFGSICMKALPDEEGIETKVSVTLTTAKSMKALPDEEGIETAVSAR